MKKLASGLILLVVLTCMIASFPKIKTASASGTIYIRADGSIDPSDAPISTNPPYYTLYTFTDNIYDSIVVERSNIVIDGNGYTLQGSSAEDSKGIDLTGRSNVTIKKMTITAFYYGVYLSYSDYNSISGNNITANNVEGICFVDSSNNTVSGNNLSYSGQEGILLDHSSNNTLTLNNITSNLWGGFPGITLTNSHNNNLNDNIVSSYNSGIKLWYSSANILDKNSVLNNYHWGIFLFYSNSNILSGNNVSNNGDDGILLYLSSDNTLADNIASNNRRNFRVEGSDFSDFNNYIDTSNTVDGKPIYYLVGVSNAIYNAEANAGVIYLIDCKNITLRDLTLTKNGYAVFLWGTTNSKIQNVTASNNAVGIWLYISNNNFISSNTVSSNDGDGIRIRSSHNNTLSGNKASSNKYWGIYLEYSSNNTLSDNTVSSNTEYGIRLDCSNSNALFGNNASNNGMEGIYLYVSQSNTLVGNNASNNDCGILLYLVSRNNTLSGNTVLNNHEYGILLGASSDYNKIFHNNFINNTIQARAWESGGDSWDDGYPSGGNYWSDYNRTNSDPEGIGDTEYVIDANNIDHYPLMGMFSDFSATSEYYVQTICNSTISDFQFDGTAIRFNVSGENGTGGFCRICIPTVLMNGTYRVFVNGTEVSCNLLPFSNSTYRYLYFNYTHSTQEVIIIPEFPSSLILPLFMIATLLAVLVYKRKHKLIPDRGYSTLAY